MSTIRINPYTSQAREGVVEVDAVNGGAIDATSHSSASLELHDGVEDFDDHGRITEKDEKVEEEPALNIVQRILSRRSTAISRHEPEPPPDGGVKAWLQGPYSYPPG